MKYLILLLIMFCSAAGATTITLTQAQVDAVLADNPPEPCEVCPPIEPPIEPPVEPPVEPPIPSQCVDSELEGTIKGWSQVWVGAFPYPTSDNVRWNVVPRKGYMAIQFNTRNFVSDGKITDLANGMTPGIRTGSYSECKGDFAVAPECKITWGLGGGLRWATNGRNNACVLKPDTVYYFNITFTDGVDGDSTTCRGAPCYVDLQYQNFN